MCNPVAIKKIEFLAFLAILLLTSCAKDSRYVKSHDRRTSKKTIILPKIPEESKLKPYVVNGQRYYPLPDADGFVQYGLASWYGKKFHGRHTANGEIYDMHKISAAHKTLPFGTYVKVLNLTNKRQTVVRINDRGPFVKKRIIDLSYAAAKEIGLIGPGVAQVKVVALGKEIGRFESPEGMKPVIEIKDLHRGEFTVQVGAFKDKNNALRLADRLKVIFDYVEVSTYSEVDKGSLYRLRVSRSKTLDSASKIEKKLEDMGFEEAFIVSL